MLLVLLLSLGVTSFAAEGDNVNYRQLSDRLVTSVFEAQFDKQFSAVPEVAECLNTYRITPAMIGTQQALDVQRQADECLKTKINSSMSEADLQRISNELGLEAFGVVKGKNSTEVIDYFSKRLKRIMTGETETANKKLKEQKLVDQKTYIDLYETQLGKSILLEIAQYCSHTLQKEQGAGATGASCPGGAGTIFDIIEGLASGSDEAQRSASMIGNLACLHDKGPTTQPSGDIYQNFLRDVAKQSGPGALSPADTATRIRKIFDNCTTLIPLMCEAHEYCKCLAANPGNSSACASNRASTAANSNSGFCGPFQPTPSRSSVPPGTQATRTPVKGEASCHVVARLRGYRLNLAETDKIQEQLRTQYSGGRQLVEHGGGSYRSDQAGPNENLDALTSLTTKDASEIIKDDKFEKQADDIDQQRCFANPERPDCYPSFYNADEAARLANASIGYNAATQVELARLDLTERDEEKLKKYLEERGYLDLVAKLDSGVTNSEIVKAAKQRLEAERDASLNQMQQAFERQQLKEGDDTRNQLKASAITDELRSRKETFQQLILFNNVVTSYLSIQRRGPDNNLTSAGTNTRALRRELDALNQEGNDSLRFFNENISDNNQLQDNESPLVDTGFLDAVLRNSGNQGTTSRQTTSGSTGGSRGTGGPVD